jgi:hypothetical protein
LTIRKALSQRLHARPRRPGRAAASGADGTDGSGGRGACLDDLLEGREDLPGTARLSRHRRTARLLGAARLGEAQKGFNEAEESHLAGRRHVPSRAHVSPSRTGGCE